MKNKHHSLAYCTETEEGPKHFQTSKLLIVYKHGQLTMLTMSRSAPEFIGVNRRKTKYSKKNKYSGPRSDTRDGLPRLGRREKFFVI